MLWIRRKKAFSGQQSAFSQNGFTTKDAKEGKIQSSVSQCARLAQSPAGLSGLRVLCGSVSLAEC
jgi:hypothetical protein